FEALQFCNRLSTMEALAPAYRVEGGTMVRVPEANGFRLPTEAEWELAARANEELLYAGSAELQTVAWYWKNGGGMTHPVGRRQPNARGLYDMSGNVGEWVWDWYAPYATTEELLDPIGPASGTVRVVRGGSYQSVSR
ncbi:MAG: SUMF1/EgtB/PvdO family nonheme iron enzyme, partial [Nitrospinota bacterium]|nr:SUMF1/EgtB/PvdO family nonheme iron enzyme [Nitrospinota bacterium]